MWPGPINPLIAAAVLVAAAITDAAYVIFTAAVAARRRSPAATWSSIWYLLSSFAVINYTQNWVTWCLLRLALGSAPMRVSLSFTEYRRHSDPRRIEWSTIS